MIPCLKSQYKESVLEETSLLSAQGLRTLVLAQSTMTKEELKAWDAEYYAASVLLNNRAN